MFLCKKCGKSFANKWNKERHEKHACSKTKIVSKTIQRNLPILRFLNRKHSRASRTILSANKDLIKAVSEICLNLRLGNVPLTDKHKSKLVEYKEILRNVSKKETSTEKKKRLLNTKGLFGALLPPVLEYLDKSRDHAKSGQTQSRQTQTLSDS